MQVGDLVKHRNERGKDPLHIDEVGIIIEVVHGGIREKYPDYRTPTAILVFYGEPQLDCGILSHEVWFHKSELELLYGNK